MSRIMCLIVVLGISASCHSRRVIMKPPSTTSSTTPSSSVSTTRPMVTTAAPSSVTATPIPKRDPAIGGLMVAKLYGFAAPELQWHAGIYTKMATPYSQICGGTIVKRDVVISAAHCFWSDDIGALSPGLFAVAAGKLLRAWDAVEDELAQQSDVSHDDLRAQVTSIQLPVRFRGQATNFQDDIAVLRLRTPLEYGPGVKPACVSFEPELEKHVLKARSGTITGWGLTQENDGGPSKHLNYLLLPYIDTEQCILRVDFDFLKYVTSDKMCAGYWNTGMALCRGDSGGGLIFDYTKPDTLTAPYLIGIASTAQRANDKECNALTPASFTQLSFHKTFLQNHLPGLEEECRIVYPRNSSERASESQVETTSSSPGTIPTTTTQTPTMTTPTTTMTTPTTTMTLSSPTTTTSTPTSTPESGSGGLPKPAAPKLQWHAAIYFKTPTEYRYVCAGSVVKRDVIISAAHCFYDEQFNSAPFVAAAGKLLKPYSASEDTYAQYSHVKTVSFPKTYKGAKTYYQDDIAVVQLLTPFRYTAGLQPLCVSFSAALAQPDQWMDSAGQPAPTYHRLTGWSLSDFSYGGSLPTLESRMVPMSERTHCQMSYGPDFSKFLTSDKICAGFWTTAKALCQGDSGTGLTHYSYINNSTLAPYLFAVASTLQGLDKICNVPELSPATFTLITSHEEFLKEQVPGLEEECRDVYLGRVQSEEDGGNQGGRIGPEAAAKENTVQNKGSSVITPAPTTSPNTEAPKLPMQAMQTIADVNQSKPDVRVSVDNGIVKITVTSVHTVTFELPRKLVN